MKFIKRLTVLNISINYNLIDEKKNKRIFAILIGRAGSSAFPGKNILKINGKHLFEYPLIEALKVKKIEKLFISTDCPVILKKSKRYKVEYIKRPKYLANKKALGEDVFHHAYLNILKKEKITSDQIEALVLLLANGATVNKNLISKGIEILSKNKKFDSAVSVSKYNMWSPLRARKLNKDGSLIPFVPFETFGNPKTPKLRSRLSRRCFICRYGSFSCKISMSRKYEKQSTPTKMDGQQNCSYLFRSRI